MADYIPLTTYKNKPFDTFEEVKQRHVAGSAKGVIKVPITCVWAIIGNYGCEKAYFPDMVHRVELIGYGLGSIRRIHFLPFGDLQGWIVEERLEAHDPENYRMMYSKLDVEDDPYPAKGVTGMIELKELSEEETEIVWTSHAIAPNTAPGSIEFLKEETEKRYSFMIEMHRKLLENDR